MGRYLGGHLVAGLVIIMVASILFVPLMEKFFIIGRALMPTDAIVLMAGDPDERIPAVVKLYKDGQSQKILLTNDGFLGSWSFQHQRQLYNIEFDEISLMEHGIPSKSIIKLPFTARGTIYDAMNSIAFAKENGIRSLMVVTSDYHSRRTLWCFEKVLNEYPISLGIHPVKPCKSDNFFLERFYEFSSEVLKFICYWWMCNKEWITTRMESIEKYGKMKNSAPAFLLLDPA